MRAHHYQMLDYYDYGPRVVLERSLGLVGFMGAGTAQVGNALAAKLGLPLRIVDRQVEHEAGMSLAALQLTHGIAARRAREHDALARSVREAPPGILVLGDGALLDPRNRRLVQTAVQLVYLQRPLPVLRHAIGVELAAAPGRYPELVVSGRVPSEADLAELLAERAAGYAIAERTFEANRLHPQRVSDALTRELGLLR